MFLDQMKNGTALVIFAGLFFSLILRGKVLLLLSVMPANKQLFPKMQPCAKTNPMMMVCEKKKSYLLQSVSERKLTKFYVKKLLAMLDVPKRAVRLQKSDIERAS